MRVLVTSSGRRVELINALATAMKGLGLVGEVFTSDASKLSPTSHLSKRHFQLPYVHDLGYSKELASLCSSEGVDLLVPTIDPELLVAAQMRDELQSMGTKVVVSDVRTIEICGDKRKTHEFLSRLGIPTPKQWPLESKTLAEIELPIVVKPARGSMSSGVIRVESKAHLSSLAGLERLDYIAESVATGLEFTVSTYVDRQGRCIAAVPRQRFDVRGGEVAKAVTRSEPEVEALAKLIVESLPGARGPLNVQMFFDPNSGSATVIEINARLGGGDPLAWMAGANVPRWILEEGLGMQPQMTQPWQSNLWMLRFDSSIFVTQDQIDES